MSSRVSIIIRTRNRPRLLARAFACVAAQSFQDWRVTLVDQGNTEVTAQFLASLAPELSAKIDHLPAPEHLRLGGLLNLGIQSSASDLIAILDDDDTWAPDFLEVMEEAIRKMPTDDFGGVACHAIKIIEDTDAQGILAPIQQTPMTTFSRVRIQDLFINAVFVIHAFVYLRSCHERVGYYDESLLFGEDREFQTRFICNYEIGVVPRALAFYHQRPKPAIAAEGNATSIRGEARPHGHSLYLNRSLRKHFEEAPESLAAVQAVSELERVIHQKFAAMDHEIQELRAKLEQMSEKIGKIDGRTKVLKDSLPKKIAS